MTQFEKDVMAHFEENVPVGYCQALDRIRCFSDLDKYFFLKWRLNRMARKGLIRRGRVYSIWQSYNGTPTYGLLSD